MNFPLKIHFLLHNLEYQYAKKLIHFLITTGCTSHEDCSGATDTCTAGQCKCGTNDMCVYGYPDWAWKCSNGKCRRN